MKPTDIFLVHLFNDYSGSPRVFSDAINGISSTLNKKIVFTSQHTGFLSDLDVEYCQIHYIKTNIKLLQLFYYIFSQIVLFWLLGFHLLKSKLRGHDTLVVVNTMLPFGAGISAKIFGATRIVYYVHESMITPHLLKLFLRAVIEKTAHNVIFVSNYLAITESFIKPRSHVLYNGLRSDFSNQPTVNHLSKHTHKQLLFVGSLKIYKGILELIKLAQLLPDFYIVAAVNCTKDELDSFEKKYPTPINMKYKVRPDDLEDLYTNSFSVLNLSLPKLWVETFGLSLLEGMHFGCPVISPPVGGPTEFVDTTNGALIDANNVNEIANILKVWANDFNLWLQLSHSAKLSASRFSTLQFQAEFSRFIKSCL